MKPHIDNTMRAALIAAFAIAVVALCGTAQVARADWPLVRGDAAATGAVAESLRRPLEILWTYDSDNSSFEATAAIVDGVVYVGDVDGTFHAVTLADGKKKWTRKFEDSGFVAGSAVVDGRIYCVDYNGIVRCLDAADGKELWNVNAETSLYAAPNVDEERVLVVDGLRQARRTRRGDWQRTLEVFHRPAATMLAHGRGRARAGGRLRRPAARRRRRHGQGPGADRHRRARPTACRPCWATAFISVLLGGVFHGMKIQPLESVWKFGQKGQSEEIHAAAVVDERGGPWYARQARRCPQSAPLARSNGASRCELAPRARR